MAGSVRARVKQLTKAQLSAMTKAQVEAHVAAVLAAVEEEKAAGRTKDLAYLYKALPGDRKSPEMKKRILPFDMDDYKKKVGPGAKKARKAKKGER